MAFDRYAVLTYVQSLFISSVTKPFSMTRIIS
jgi:hypothetical protein